MNPPVERYVIVGGTMHGVTYWHLGVAQQNAKTSGGKVMRLVPVPLEDQS